MADHPPKIICRNYPATIYYTTETSHINKTAKTLKNQYQFNQNQFL